MTRGLLLFLATFLSTALLCSPSASAHVISMSTGDAVVTGNHVQFFLRMPSYEASHVAHPETALLANVRFTSNGAPPKTLENSCFDDRAAANYVCAEYLEFPAPVETLQVESTLPAVTVPNHVLLLNAQLNNELGNKQDQAILDSSFSSATLTFHTLSNFEIFVGQAFQSARQAVNGGVRILFFFCLALAARTRRELFFILSGFLVGEAVCLSVVPRTAWFPPVRFVEAASALALSYLSFEILFQPRSLLRWPIAAVLGGAVGLSLTVFLAASGFRPTYIFAGAALVQALIVTSAGLVFLALLPRIPKRPPNLGPIPIAASLMLVTGLIWFAMRLAN